MSVEVAGIGILAAFLAGAISFLSPCVLPLVPGYVSFIAGQSDQAPGQRAEFTARIRTLGLSLCLLFMLKMYTYTAKNNAILVTAVIVFSGALWLVRSQSTVDDVSWMKAMIPHHSIAILTSSRANISDPRVKDLANRIIEAQKREIDEMKQLIENLSQ